MKTRQAVQTMFLALLLAAAPATAQTPAIPAQGPAMPALTDGATVRWSRAGVRHEGELLSADDGLLRLRVGNETSSLQAASLDSLWIRRDRRTAGGIIGFVVGATPVFLACRDTVDECGIVPNAILLVGTTTLLGTWLGSRVERWVRQWP